MWRWNLCFTYQYYINNEIEKQRYFQENSSLLRRRKTNHQYITLPCIFCLATQEPPADIFLILLRMFFHEEKSYNTPIALIIQYSS